MESTTSSREAISVALDAQLASLEEAITNAVQFRDVEGGILDLFYAARALVQQLTEASDDDLRVCGVVTGGWIEHGSSFTDICENPRPCADHSAEAWLTERNRANDAEEALEIARDQLNELADTLLNKTIHDNETCHCGHGESCDNPVAGVWLLPAYDGSYEGATWLLCKGCGEKCTGTPPAAPIAAVPSEEVSNA